MLTVFLRISFARPLFRAKLHEEYDLIASDVFRSSIPFHSSREHLGSNVLLHAPSSLYSAMIPLLFYAGIGAAALAIISLYRLAAKPDFQSFATSLPGLTLWGSLLILVGAVHWITRVYSGSGAFQRRACVVALMVTSISTLLVVGSAELLVRARSVDTVRGTMFGRTLLHPLDWRQVVVHHGPVLERMSHERPFFEYDPFLGWIVAPNHRSSSGLYMSSAEGLRSGQVGVEFADSRNRLTGRIEHPASIRIALLGNSMTFGHEVSCDDSWPHFLERNLGPDVQVLNFGVSGYGVSQAFLQYRRDVRSWHSQVVIMGVTSADILRMMNIYNFLISPTGIEFPYARPRIVPGSVDLRPINQPIPTPKEIFSFRSVHDLPHLEYDRFFHNTEWPRAGTWALVEWSYLFRFLSSARPLVAPLSPALSDDALVDLSRNVLTTFLDDVRRDGAVPLIVHLPYQDELNAEAQGRTIEAPYGATLLRRTGISFVEAAPCLIATKTLDSFAPGGHYTAPASERIAECLADILRSMRAI